MYWSMEKNLDAEKKIKILLTNNILNQHVYHSNNYHLMETYIGDNVFRDGNVDCKIVFSDVGIS